MNYQMVIVICPCCATPMDAPVDDMQREFECLSCGQAWRMAVEADRFTEHALT